jgi:hypothetical protein
MDSPIEGSRHMNETKYKLMLAGGVWLATTVAVPAQAQNDPPVESGQVESGRAESEQAASDILPLPTANGPGSPAFGATSSASPAYSEPVYSEADCPPRRMGPVGRWRQRRRARAQDKCWGYPEEFQDAPLGAMLNAHMTAGIASGQAARMVLYQYDFYPESNQLKPRGKAQVAKIASWLSMNPFLIFVEPSGSDAGLDEARRQIVWRELAGGPCPVPLERVVVGTGASNGINGLEALAIDRSRYNQTSARGVGAGAAAGAPGSPGAAAGASSSAATLAR